MSEGHGAAVDVHSLRIHFERPHVRQCLNRERLVQLHQAIVPDASVLLFHEILHCGDGCKE